MISCSFKNYEDDALFQFVIMICAIITLVVYIKRKEK